MNPRSLRPANSGRPDVVGLVPAAGRGTRLQPLACSKEIVPIGQVVDRADGATRSKVAIEYLLEKFQTAGIAKTVVVIRDGKWDIPGLLGDGLRFGTALAYVVIPGSMGPPDTIDRAYSFVKPYRVAFGFPDILFEPRNAFAQLIAKQEATGADAVLGLQSIEDRSRWDMVETDESGRVLSIVMKPVETTLEFGWHFAVWTPAFTEFLHQFLRAEQTHQEMHRFANKANDPGGDLAMGVVFQQALESGLTFSSVKFSESACLDIGNPENLAKAAGLFS